MEEILQQYRRLTEELHIDAQAASRLILANEIRSIRDGMTDAATEVATSVSDISNSLDNLQWNAVT